MSPTKSKVEDNNSGIRRLFTSENQINMSSESQVKVSSTLKPNDLTKVESEKPSKFKKK